MTVPDSQRCELIRFSFTMRLLQKVRSKRATFRGQTHSFMLPNTKTHCQVNALQEMKHPVSSEGTLAQHTAVKCPQDMECFDTVST